MDEGESSASKENQAKKVIEKAPVKKLTITVDNDQTIANVSPQTKAELQSWGSEVDAESRGSGNQQPDADDDEDQDNAAGGSPMQGVE